jgi:hypothetical protein
LVPAVANHRFSTTPGSSRGGSQAGKFEETEVRSRAMKSNEAEVPLIYHESSRVSK